MNSLSGGVVGEHMKDHNGKMDREDGGRCLNEEVERQVCSFLCSCSDAQR